jgi:hypothetical protein
MLLPVLVIVIGACEPSTSRVIVVLTDVSKTVGAPDVKTYIESFSALVETLNPGDRLVLARISEQSMADFTVDFDAILPNTDVYVDDVEAQDSVIALANSAFSTLLQDRSAMKSDILSAIAVAAEIFSRDEDHTERWLLVFSDMRHESSTLNLDLQQIDSTFTSNFVRREREAGSMPDLSNVRVRVVGAGASDNKTDSYRALRNFWLAYFGEAGALISAADYGRTALVAPRVERQGR